jgi:hypothetical protein
LNQKKLSGPQPTSVSRPASFEIKTPLSLLNRLVVGWVRARRMLNQKKCTGPQPTSVSGAASLEIKAPLF